MAQPAEDAPLARGSLTGSEDALILPGEPRGGSNSRALKVAGLTTLACLLLASQVFTAYMVFDQKQQIHSLQKNSDRLGRQMTRSSQAPVKMQRAMNSLPLMMDFALDQDAKTETVTPQAKLQDAIVSVEMQLKDLMKDSPLPQFNETFLANLQSLKQHMNESEWQSFDQWMRYWLIFQMAQQAPAPPTAQSATLIKTKCQMEAAPGTSKLGAYKPQCDEQGHYKPMQCWPPTGFCWCVDQTGAIIPGTSIRGHPDCRRVHPRRKMFVPMPLQKAFSADE